MVWLATNACNARCQHCSSNSTCRTPDELSTAEALAMIDELAGAGVVDLAISGGEPLLRRDLFRIIDRARQRGLAVGVGSNGARLRGAIVARLAASGINRLQISLDGLATSHDTLRCWPGLFVRAVQSIRTAHQAGLRVHVCCTITRLNVDELDAFCALVAGLPVQRINFSRYVPTGRGTDALDLPDDAWRQVVGQTSELRAQYRGRLEIVGHLAQQVLVDDTVSAMPSFGGCQAGAAQGCIASNGDVYPCVLLPIPVGNIRRERLNTIWRDAPLLNQLRDRNHLLGACGSCAVREDCGGCRAVAYARTGDVFATDPRCWIAESAPRHRNTQPLTIGSRGAHHG
jgi:radical SAM protein with 4Fe4S-binding SPASM domain